MHKDFRGHGPVLIREDGKYVCLNILTITQMDKTGTTIRVFNPIITIHYDYRSANQTGIITKEWC
ncbi:hypothetical protein [Chitinophaga silvisoli]|uniref:hypothetical protein n=1 Tax=Chitinophaga silvisoli TaxID=2291814 RepID=UPI0013140F05|nr:hypothetical protein [Chitinophaga silvisoli]